MPNPVSIPSVSVIIPAFNRAETIQAAIESVLHQTWTDFELLIVDDGSTDGTLEEAGKVKDPRIRLFSNPRNMGASAARNTGIRAARGRWIAFQDSDDEWLPLKLEKQMARLAEADPNTVAAYCGLLVLDPLRMSARGRLNVKYIPPSDQERVQGDIVPPLLTTSFVSTQTLIARRDAIEQAGGFDESILALVDYEFMLRLAQLGPVAFVDEPLVLQRFSPNSITRGLEGHVEMRARIVEKHRELFARDPAALAKAYYGIAGGYRSLGNFAAARDALAKARRIQPGRLRLWAMTGYVSVLNLIGRGAARPERPT